MKGKKIKLLILPAALALVAMCLPVISNAQQKEWTQILHHHHADSCVGTSLQYQSADSNGWLRTVSRDTCASCKGYHDNYEFDCTCSCGAHWNTFGHACVNSPYGTNGGSCSNYSKINCSTLHMHPVTSYVCGMDENSSLGTVQVTLDTITPTQSANLIAAYEGTLADISLKWDGESVDESLFVEENGNYVLNILYTENGLPYSEEINVCVSNIDKTKPEITEINVSEEEFTKEDILISIQAADEGGLPSEAYSFDGESYSDSNVFSVNENGTYTIWVKDEAGNIASEEIEISNIDKLAPVIESTYSPKPWYEGACTLNVAAYDSEEEKNAASGLCTKPYSWDLGKTWTEDSKFVIQTPGTYVVWVQDMAGNIGKANVEAKLEVRPTQPTQPSTNGQEDSGASVQPVQEEETNQPSEEMHQNTKPEFTHTHAGQSMEEERELTIESIPDAATKEEQTIRPVVVPNLSNPMEAGSEEGKPADSISVIKQPSKMSTTAKIVTITAASLSGAILIAAGLFFLLFTATVYYVSERGDLAAVGKVFIVCRNGKWSVNISKEMAGRAKTKNMRLKLPKWFVGAFHYNPFSITCNDIRTDKMVDYSIDFQIQY